MLKATVIAIVVLYCIATLSIGARLYMKEVVVVGASGDAVLCEDAAGEIWSYYGEAAQGDNLTFVMNSKGTASTYDDIIIRIA